MQSVVDSGAGSRDAFMVNQLQTLVSNKNTQGII